ncbi:MAG: sulfurtransferase, partial [Desulfotignum sp.]|nr:sulfurtransferase [Desulfotignum sp.]
MKTDTVKKMLAVLGTGLMLMAGAVSAGATESWMYPEVVEADFVIAHMSVPMPDNVMIIDSRPYKPMYVKGHIPG